MSNDVYILPNGDGTFDLRIGTKDGGIIGPRLIKLPPEQLVQFKYPADFKGIKSIEEALTAQKKWDEFLQNQNARLTQGKKR